MLPDEHMARINREPPEDIPKILNTIKAIKSQHYLCYRQGICNMHVPEMYGAVRFSETVVGTGYDNLVEKA